MTATLDARLVIGGLWEGAPVVATHPIYAGHQAGSNAVVLGGDWCIQHEQMAIDSDSWRFAFVEGGQSRSTSGGWVLSLRLPGPLGLGLLGLEARCAARVSGWAGHYPEWLSDKSTDPGYADLALWLSQYLAMTDALAAKQGWPTGPGAPVYGWRWHEEIKCWLLTGRAPTMPRTSGSISFGVGARHDCAVPALEGVTDPMEALEAASGAL